MTSIPDGDAGQRVRHFRYGMRLARLLAVLLVMPLAGGLWLIWADSGLVAAAALVEVFSGGKLTLEAPVGRLAGPLQLGAMVWRSDGNTLRMDNVVVAPAWSDLIGGSLHLEILEVGRLQFALAPTPVPPMLPESLRLPLAVEIDTLRVKRIERGTTLLAEEVELRFSSRDDQIRLEDVRARRGSLELKGQASLATAFPFTLQARTRLGAAIIPGNPGPGFVLDINANGPLAQIETHAEASTTGGGQRLRGRADILLTPFSRHLFSTGKIDLAGIDPADWFASAPQADLDLRAELRPLAPTSTGVSGVEGTVVVINHRPGTLDSNRLPLQRLTGQLHGEVTEEGELVRLDKLLVTVPGGGQLSGDAHYSGTKLTMKLMTRDLDAARWHGRLRPTRLAGPVDIQFAPTATEVTLALAGKALALSAQVRRHGERVDVDKMQLQTGAARLNVSGSFLADSTQAFDIRGELDRFDPGAFIRMPAARINASFTMAGRLRPLPELQLDFMVTESRFAGSPLSGKGKVAIAWPAVRQADIHFDAGGNLLKVQGAFGHPGETLKLTIDAPQLAELGLEGGISASVVASGTPEAATIVARLQSAQLAWSGHGRAQGIDVDIAAGSRQEDPLRVKLVLASLGTPSQPGLGKNLLLDIGGTRQNHTLSAQAEIESLGQLRVSAAGGVGAAPLPLVWSGTLNHLELVRPARNSATAVLRLERPASMRASADNWSIGPAELAGEQWQGRLAANADGKRSRFDAVVQGPRIGEVTAYLETGMSAPWQVDRQAAWQGTARFAVTDLAWLGPLLDAGWRSAGRLEGQFRLGGSPARPVGDGVVQGNNLALHLIDQGLRLENGELRATLDKDQLRIDKLGFDSPLQSPPLVLGREEQGGVLTRSPGRLDITGALQIASADHDGQGALDIRLDRLGIFQTPEQWVAVSGGGKLRWQENALSLVGDAKVDAGYWQLAKPGAPKLSDDVVIRKPGAVATPHVRRWALTQQLDFDLGPNFLLRGGGLDTRLAGNVRLTSTGRDLLRASGSIRTVAGRFDAYGQQLVIERGVLNFRDLLENPALNLRAVRQGLPVEPGVEITGTARKPVVRLVSDPEMPDAEKLSWLVLGHGAEHASNTDVGVLLAAAGSILGGTSGGVVRQLKQTFGLDEFGLRHGKVGDPGGFQGTSRVAGGSYDSSAVEGEQILTVGKRLSDNVLLAYEQAMGTTESVVKLTVKLTRQLSLIGRAGSDNALDVFYTLRFGQ